MASVDMSQWVAQFTLDELQRLACAEPLSEILWTLNETEHGTDAPDRLHAFGELLAHPARTPDLDRLLLMPYLVRYVWEVPHSAYTAAAWHHLCLMVDDSDWASLTPLALDILDQHPHGALRAEVLRWDADDLCHWCEHLWRQPGLVGRAARLLSEDPAPAVRAAAVTGLFLMDPKPRDQTGVGLAHLLDRLRCDPAAEVRGVLFDGICAGRGVVPMSDTVDAALIAALQDAGNRSVLPAMLFCYASTRLARPVSEPDTAAVVLNAIAAHTNSPRGADLRKALGFLEPAMGKRDAEAATVWLSRAPFANGEALVQCARGMFESPQLALAHRAHALTLLSRLGQPVEPHAMEGFLLAPAQTAALLDLTVGAYRLFSALLAAQQWPDGPVNLYRRLTTHVRSRPDVGGEAKHGDAYAQAITEQTLRLALAGCGSQRLLDEVVCTVRDWSGDLSAALYDLGRSDTELVLDGLLDLALHAHNPGVRAGGAGLLGRRVGLPDAKALAMLLQLLHTRHDAELASEAFHQLPERHELNADWSARLTAAVGWVQDMQPEEHDHLLNHAIYRIRTWCT